MHQIKNYYSVLIIALVVNFALWENAWYWILAGILVLVFIGSIIRETANPVSDQQHGTTYCPCCNSRHYKVEVRPAYWQSIGALKATKNRYHHTCLDCGKKWTVAYHESDT